VSDARTRPGRRGRLGIELAGAIGVAGTLLMYLSVSAIVPAAIALGYGESPWPFLGATAIAAAVGRGLAQIGRGRETRVGFREGYLVVAVTWLLAAAFGALPYLLSGDAQLDRPLDALFEAMSGFTTTGASILTDIEGLDRSMAMWRQLTQWLGGMGIIVLALAVLPRLRVGGRQLLESELPGPEVEDFATRIRSTARRLWALYVGLTAALVVLLLAIGWSGLDEAMTPFHAFAHAFSTMPTGGFSPKARSIEAFGPATEWALTAFMIIAGINFALIWRATVRRQPRVAIRDEELRVYLLAAVLGSAILIAVLWKEDIAGHADAIRHGTFQAVSIMTTTGFASVDFSGWSTLPLMTLVALMFVGGSAISTAGSIKVVRHLLLARVLRREVRRSVHRELVEPIRLNGRVIDERTVRAAVSFILLYVGTFVIGSGVIALDTALQGPEMRPINVLAVTATTLGNVGPGLSPAGPMGSFESFSDVSTATMTVLMWLGRLELIPVFVLLSRRYWRR